MSTIGTYVYVGIELKDRDSRVVRNFYDTTGTDTMGENGKKCKPEESDIQFQKIETMKTVLFATLAASAAAFAPQSASKASTAMNGAMEDLKEVAEKSNPVLKVSKSHSLRL